MTQWGCPGSELPSCGVDFRSGDVFLTRSNTFLGKAIRWATTGAGEKPSEANHVGVVVASGWANEAGIVEAMWRVRYGIFTQFYGDDTTEIQVWRCDGLSWKERFRVSDFMMDHVGAPYNVGRIALNLIDGLLAKALRRKDVYIARRFTFLGRPICSTLVAQAFQSIGRSFGVDATRATPDDILDWFEHDGWRRVL